MSECQNTGTWDRMTRLAADEGVDFDAVVEAANHPDDDHDHGTPAKTGAYYSDLIFVLTHLRVPAQDSRALWDRMRAHRATLTDALERDPGILVAAADLLINLEARLERSVLIDARRLNRVITTATHDGLTGLQDHATGMRSLERELERAERESLSVSLLMIDIDHFKKFNDAHGHVKGDDALAAAAQAILASVRGMDHVMRYGGEEFCVVLPHVDGAEASVTAERVRSAVRRWSPVRVSIGVATSVAGTSAARGLVELADGALYAAKAAGRDCVRVAGRA